jgi:hypothetical protein
MGNAHLNWIGEILSQLDSIINIYVENKYITKSYDVETFLLV